MDFLRLNKRPFYVLPVLLLAGLLLVKVFPTFYVSFNAPVYLTVHTILEFLSIVVSLTVFVVAWYNYQQTADTRELVICLTFFAVGVIDFAHTLSYEGMPLFFSGNSVNKSVTYWIIARLIEGAGLLIAVVIPAGFSGFFTRPLPMLILTPIVTSFILVAVAYNDSKLPLLFVAGLGQTPLKIRLEYLVIVFKAVSLWILARRREEPAGSYYLQIAFIFGVFAEFAFSLYSGPYDTYNFIGHIYKIGAFACILRGLFVSSVVRLYETNRVLREQKRLLALANHRLAEADRLKTEFLANTNHELRTPLTAILAFTELLLDKETGPVNETQQDYLNEIYDSGIQLLNDINNLLDLSKIESGKMHLKPVPVDVRSIIAGGARKFEPVLKLKNQRLIYHVSDDISEVQIDMSLIIKILNNLLGNAHKFTPEGGTIRLDISFLPEGEELLFVVEDNGIGIRPEDQAVIFEKFRQVDGSATRPYHGTGLGLTLVKHLVELHGGRIWVASSPGKGAKFSFTVKTDMSLEVG